MSLTAEELTGMCERYGGLDRFKNAVESIREALRNKGFTVTKFEDFAAACAQFEFSIDSAIDQSALTTKGREAFKSIIMRKLNHTIEFWETHNITENVCQGDIDILFVPHGVTVVPGSCAYAFQNCASLMWVDPEIDWSKATNMQYLFYGTNELNNSFLTFDMANCSSIRFLQANVDEIRLKNLGKNGVRFASQMNTSAFKSKNVYGLNASWLQSQNPGYCIVGTDGKCTHVEFEGFIRNKNDLSYNPVGSYLKNIDDETLWGLCKHAYDYNHKEVNDDGYGRNVNIDLPTSEGALNYGFHDAQKQRLEAYFLTLPEGERRDADGTLCTSVEQYMTAKGWTY